MRRTIVIYFNHIGKLDYPLSDPNYLAAYRQFGVYCQQRQTKLIVAREGSYQGTMRFARGWQFSGDQLTAVPGPITADVVYVKGSTFPVPVARGDVVVNDPIFNKDGQNKWLTYQAFPDLMPQTFQITVTNWREVVAQIPSERIVLKPEAGFGGKGIIIADRSTVDFPALGLKTPYLAQEFIDSSEGIPGICTGYHDLRLILFGGEPRLALVRLPKRGGLLSNLAQGGSGFAVDLARVPASVLEVAHAIDTHFTQYPSRIYTTDFFFSGGRPYLIEINTQPGFPTIEDETFRQTFYRSLYDVLDRAIQARQP